MEYKYKEGEEVYATGNPSLKLVVDLTGVMIKKYNFKNDHIRQDTIF